MKKLYHLTGFGLILTSGCFQNPLICAQFHLQNNVISMSNHKVFISCGTLGLASANAAISGTPAIGAGFDLGSTFHAGCTLFSIARDNARLNIGIEHSMNNTIQHPPRNLWSIYFCTSSIDQESVIFKKILKKLNKMGQANFSKNYAFIENYLQNKKTDISLIQSLIKSTNAIFGIGNSASDNSGFINHAFTFFFGLLFNIDSWFALEMRVVCIAKESDFDVITGNKARSIEYAKYNPRYIYKPDERGNIGLVFKVVLFIFQ